MWQLARPDQAFPGPGSLPRQPPARFVPVRPWGGVRGAAAAASPAAFRGAAAPVPAQGLLRGAPAGELGGAGPARPPCLPGGAGAPAGAGSRAPLKGVRIAGRASGQASERATRRRGRSARRAARGGISRLRRGGHGMISASLACPGCPRSAEAGAAPPAAFHGGTVRLRRLPGLLQYVLGAAPESPVGSRGHGQRLVVTVLMRGFKLAW